MYNDKRIRTCSNQCHTHIQGLQRMNFMFSSHFAFSATFRLLLYLVKWCNNPNSWSEEEKTFHCAPCEHLFFILAKFCWWKNVLKAHCKTDDAAKMAVRTVFAKA